MVSSSESSKSHPDAHVRHHWFSFIAASAVLLAGSAIALGQGPQKTLPNAPLPANLSLNTHSSDPKAGASQPKNASDASQASGSLPANTISLYTAVDLALRNSKSVGVATAEVQRAQAVLLGLRKAYIPNFTIGSGIGPPSYGFPLGTPNIFNAGSQSLVFSFSQSDYIRSAHAAVKSADFSLQDARQKVILDTASSYLELDKTLRQLAAIRQAMDDADHLISIVDSRVAAGVDSHVQETRARLTRAQMRVQEIHLEDRAEELQAHLSGVMGLPAGPISVSSASIPPITNLDIHADNLSAQHDPSVQAAFATADARSLTARGDERQNYRPTVEQIAQYSLFSTFENYQQYYLGYQANNFGFELQVVLPIFDPVRRAKGIESRAEALSARNQAEQTKIQFTENNLALLHSLNELKAQQDVAELQQELAKDTLATVQTQIKNGTGSPDAPAITPQQSEQAQIDERNRYIDMLNAEFDVQHTELELLTAIGGLEAWAKQSVPSNAGSNSIAPQVLHTGK